MKAFFAASGVCHSAEQQFSLGDVHGRPESKSCAAVSITSPRAPRRKRACKHDLHCHLSFQIDAHELMSAAGMPSWLLSCCS